MTTEAAVIESRFPDALCRGRKILVAGTPYAASPTRQSTTSSYVVGNGTAYIDMDAYRQAVFDVDFLLVSGAGGRIKLEWSDDNTYFFQEDYEDSSTVGIIARALVVHTFTATGKYCFPIPKLHRYMKVSITNNEVGAVSGFAIGVTPVVI